MNLGVTDDFPKDINPPSESQKKILTVENQAAMPILATHRRVCIHGTRIFNQILATNSGSVRTVS
ncbi:hypothetical protein NSMS1_67960 (plasmid) [Nostoc sp. MS1]|nr:hypothetical protein NSMS1_67960 [Nostoc sp. MS1]